MMELKPGRYYRMRNGEKAHIYKISVLQNADTYYPVKGHVKGVPMRWAGTNYYYQGNESIYDLMEEWQEPTTETVKLPEKFSVVGEPSGSVTGVINQLLDYISSLERRVAALEPDNGGEK